MWHYPALEVLNKWIDKDIPGPNGMQTQPLGFRSNAISLEQMPLGRCSEVALQLMGTGRLHISCLRALYRLEGIDNRGFMVGTEMTRWI